MTRLKILLMNVLLLLAVALHAFDKSTYYQRANGQRGAALKTALYGIVGNPSVKSYGSLWTYYYQTDRLSDNQVVDRYSNEKRYFAGNSGNAVSGMNREHGIPKSWWGGGTAGIGSDLHHVMPSDAAANSAKSNYGMGVVTTGVNYNNGSIKVGRGAAGSNGSVLLWEPADEWKGDFARIYFYIVTSYEEKNLTQQQGVNSMQANTYPKLQPWAYELYMKWSREDPVSDAERRRNEVVYGIQGNRNPFIDYEGLEQYIWGDHKEEPFSASAYVSPYGDTPPGPEPDPDPEPKPDPDPDPQSDGDAYVRLTTAPADWAGSYLIVCEAEGVAMDGSLEVFDKTYNTIPVDISGGTIAVTAATEKAEFAVTPFSQGYALRGQGGKYVGAKDSGNGLATSDTPLANLLSVTSAGEAVITSEYGNSLRFNAADSQKRFRYYKSGQQPVVLYRRTVADGIRAAEAASAVSFGGADAVFDLAGRRVPRVSRPGLYIVNGKKVHVK